MLRKEIGEESDQEEATDAGEKSDTDQDYDESDNESDVGNDYEYDEDETVIRPMAGL